jgi:thioredoxin-dependent peroxiredoxin
MLAVGDRAPEFTLADHAGKDVSLTSLLNRGELLLYFYRAGFTPGSTRQACTIRDLHEQIRQRNLAIVGVSPQRPEKHRRFRAKYKLPFTLLSDLDKSVIKMYEVNGPLGFGVRRATYLIDRGRIIRGAVLADFRISQHEAFIRKTVSLADASH